MVDLQQTLRNAVADLVAEAERCQQAADALMGIMNSGSGPTTKPSSKRRMSAAARRRISQAQKLRWAKWKKKQGTKRRA